MLKPKKKITKRELKQDKFVIFTLKAKDYIEENARKLLRIGIGILIFIILVFFYIRSKHNANIQANSLLGEAQLALQLGDSDRALKTLKQLVEDYDGVTAAGQGCFLLAKLYWEQDDTTNAKIYFKKYIDDYGDDDLLFSAALAGYADCLLKEGNIKKAAEHYEKAARVNRELPLTPSYLFSAASAYLEIQDYQKARKLAEDIIQNFENSEYKTQAEVLLYKIQFST